MHPYWGIVFLILAACLLRSIILSSFKKFRRPKTLTRHRAVPESRPTLHTSSPTPPVSPPSTDTDVHALLRSKFQSVTPPPKVQEVSPKPPPTTSRLHQFEQDRIERQKRIARETQKRLEEANKKRIQEQYPHGIKLSEIAPSHTPPSKKSQSSPSTQKSRQFVPLPCTNSSTTSPSVSTTCSVPPLLVPDSPVSPKFSTPEYIQQTTRQISTDLQILKLHELPEAQIMARSFILELIPELASIGVTPESIPESGVPFSVLPRLCVKFKETFEFVKFGSISCHRCGSETISQGSSPPTSPEIDPSWLCSRVETFYCPVCTEKTYFYRCNNPIKILEERKGRCGEFANVFTLLCRSLGFHSRLVVDVSPEKGDHVWTEAYDAKGEYKEGDVWQSEEEKKQGASHKSGDSVSSSSSTPSFVPPASTSSSASPSPRTAPRYICFDSCEGFTDRPLVYESGWGKTISRVLALSLEGVYDVTQRYTTANAVPLPGIGVPPASSPSASPSPPASSMAWMSAQLGQINKELLSYMPMDQRVKVVKRRADEVKEMKETHQAVVQKLQRKGADALKDEEKLDRLSGS